MSALRTSHYDREKGRKKEGIPILDLYHRAQGVFYCLIVSLLVGLHNHYTDWHSKES
jgi:hypothetical protein